MLDEGVLGLMFHTYDLASAKFREKTQSHNEPPNGARLVPSANHSIHKQ